MPRINMWEIAQRLGVDRATVSRALSADKAHLVAPATRERIREEAARLGYRPNLTASSLRRGRSQTVAILAPDLANEVIIKVIREIVTQLRHGDGERLNITPLIAETMDKPKDTEMLVDMFLLRRVDAIITLASTELDVEMLQAAANEVPVVLAVRSVNGAVFPSSTCDDELGGAMVASHLVSRGHRVVCQVKGPQMAATFRNRAAGFSNVCVRQGLIESPLQVETKTATSSEGKLALDAILAVRERPTAVFAHNDALALGLIEAMRQRGLKYPDDLAVAGFNNTELSRVLAVPLTTAEYPVNEVSTHAAALVRGLIANPDMEWQSKVFKPILIPRASA